ncbi:ESPR-type extended signal peptide-containing protein, partial [Psychrobacter sp. 1U2]|uniref:ESPR domain-containing protein n=1 Tax=Psychrobacter sp. 1U2 TaxID=3453577 RepID=UPI003F44C811
MNRNYKVVWNRSLGCFTAVAEYAKSRGKSSSSTVSSSSATTVSTGGAKLLRLSALCIGMTAAGFSVQAVAAVGNNSIDTPNCGTGGNVANNSTGDIAVGCGSNSAGTNAIAIGGNATTQVNAGQTQGGQSVAIGFDAQTKGDQSVGIGANIRASGDSSIAIGGDDLNKVAGTNNNSAAAQTYKTLTGDNLIRAYDGQTGANNQYYGTTTGSGAIAIGVQASALGNLSTSFGTRTQANGVASTALGVGATSSKDGSVALGAGSSTATDATKVTSATVNGIEFTGFTGFAGTADNTGRQVSVGSKGNERQIKNVAPGALSATSTDAINGSQIYAVSNKLIDNIKEVKTTVDNVAAGTAGIVRQDAGTGAITVGAQTGGSSV